MKDENKLLDERLEGQTTRRTNIWDTLKEVGEGRGISYSPRPSFPSKQNRIANQNQVSTDPVTKRDGGRRSRRITVLKWLYQQRHKYIPRFNSTRRVLSKLESLER